MLACTLVSDAYTNWCCMWCSAGQVCFSMLQNRSLPSWCPYFHNDVKYVSRCCRMHCNADIVCFAFLLNSYSPSWYACMHKQMRFNFLHDSLANSQQSPRLCLAMPGLVCIIQLLKLCHHSLLDASTTTRSNPWLLACLQINQYAISV